jgi:hypothetical protein
MRQQLVGTEHSSLLLRHDSGFLVSGLSTKVHFTFFYFFHAYYMSALPSNNILCKCYFWVGLQVALVGPQQQKALNSKYAFCFVQAHTAEEDMRWMKYVACMRHDR